MKRLNQCAPATALLASLAFLAARVLSAQTPQPLPVARTYTVQYRTDLATGTWSTLTGTTESDTGNERTVTDPNSPRPIFYNVRINKP